MTYIHQLRDWPKFRWNLPTERLAAVSRHQGRLIGRMEGLGFPQRQEAVLRTLTADVIKSSEIEGERLDAEQVRSSLARRLGIEVAGLKPADRHVDGVVEMMLDATGNYAKPLTAERLFGWHASLFPTGFSGMRRIRTAAWRDADSGPMQVVSGAIGREKIHYEAPDADRLDAEMAAFLQFFGNDGGMDPILKAGLAHFWFVTIHPFEDGNGRIARAIADLCLARSEGSSQRFYSMSGQIREERKEYYEVLGLAQRGTMDITPWMEWFIVCLGRAIGRAEAELGAVVARARVWEAVNALPVNDRQRLMLNRLTSGFHGNLTTAKWAQIAKCSHDTALRDIQDLMTRGILIQNPGGSRNISYSLAAVGRD